MAYKKEATVTHQSYLLPLFCCMECSHCVSLQRFIVKLEIMNSLKGFIYGIATSVTFGLIPLFTLPFSFLPLHWAS